MTVEPVETIGDGVPATGFDKLGAAGALPGLPHLTLTQR